MNVTSSYFNKKSVVGMVSGSAIIAIVLAVFLFMPSEMMLNEIGYAEIQDESNPIVAEINDQKIRLEDVQDAVNMETSQGQMIDSATALDRMIAKILLLEEAQARNITITMAEVEEEIISMYAQSGLSQAQFEEKLEEIGTSYDQTLEMYREELIINKMLSDEVSKAEIQISDEDAKLVFDENKNAILSQVGNSTVFEDISSQIKTTLLQQKQQKITLDIIEHLIEKAVIITYEDRLQ
jgi:parvulin-like peptidyl-prolyl isomerase